MKKNNLPDCTGCTDPRSEGTHQMGTKQHPTTDKEKIEELQTNLHDLFEAQKSMVTLGEDGMTGWDFVELRDAVAQFVQEREREVVEGFVEYLFKKNESVYEEGVGHFLDAIRLEMQNYLKQKEGKE